MVRTIIDKMPMHGCYVEVFAGGASVFFQKPPSQSEVINDLDKDLVTLYRSVKNHPEELYRQFKFSLVSRMEFEREQKVAAETLTDIQRAARYLYLQKTAFGGKIVGQTFGTATTGKPRLNILNLESTLEQAWQRLAQVQIECLDFRNLIQKYDREHTFFFLDPPYWNIPGYKADFIEQDLSLPSVPDHMGKWQQKEGVHQTIDPAGNWERKTDKTISDFAKEIHETTSGDRSETIGGESSEAVTGAKKTTAAAYQVTAPTITIGAPNGGPSLLPLITSALNDIKFALDIIADHTHPSDNTASPNASAIHAKAAGVGTTNESLQTLQ